MGIIKHQNGDIISPEDMAITYSRRTVKTERYEIWQHPYIKDNVVSDSFDLQLVLFYPDNLVESYHVSDTMHHLEDVSQLIKLQLVYHDIALKFKEYTHLVNDIYSDEADLYFESVLLSKGILPKK